MAVAPIDQMSCSDGWFVTGYYTPEDAEFEGDPVEIPVKGKGTQEFPAGFLRHVRIEGWGLTRFGWFLGWNAGWIAGDDPLNALGRRLTIGSIAVDRTIIPLGTRIRMPNLVSPWDQQEFVADDTGGGINGKHVDIYCGAGQGARTETFRVTAHDRQVCVGD